MTPRLHLLTTYSTTLLQWRMGGGDTVLMEDPAQAHAVAAQALRLATRSQRPHVVLLGMGDGTLAATLLQSMPAGMTLIVCSLQPEEVRAALVRSDLAAHLATGHLHVAADTSPWALLHLFLGASISPLQCTFCSNPTVDDTQLAQLRHWQRLLHDATPVVLPDTHHCPCHTPAGTAGKAPLTVGAILHPEEPALADFFAHIPAWVHELVVVWDAHKPPAHHYPCAVPVRQTARPLASDFSAQRNHMLDLARSKAPASAHWLLYLDADERFAAATWQTVRALVTHHDAPQQSTATQHAGTTPHAAAAPLPDAPPAPHASVTPTPGAIVFPRHTFHPDANNVRMGYGLWPDLQVRLFRTTPDVHFQRPVHEVVMGIAGATLLLPAHPILHHSHLLRDREALQARLGIFNLAAGNPVHRLSGGYPHLPANFFAQLESPLAHTGILLANAP